MGGGLWICSTGVTSANYVALLLPLLVLVGARRLLHCGDRFLVALDDGSAPSPLKREVDSNFPPQIIRWKMSSIGNWSENGRVERTALHLRSVQIAFFLLCLGSRGEVDVGKGHTT